MDSCLAGVPAGHLLVVAAALLQSAQAPPSANPDANYKFHTAFAIINSVTKYIQLEFTFLFDSGISGMKQNVNMVNFFCGRTETL